MCSHIFTAKSILDCIPMLTSLIPSSWMASKAIVMFSRACGCDCGLLLCRTFLFCSVSTRATSLQQICQKQNISVRYSVLNSIKSAENDIGSMLGSDRAISYSAWCSCQVDTATAWLHCHKQWLFIKAPSSLKPCSVVLQCTTKYHLFYVKTLKYSQCAMSSCPNNPQFWRLELN